VASATTTGGSDYYTRDATGNLVSLRTASGNRYYYLFDGLGSVVARQQRRFEGQHLQLRPLRHATVSQRDRGQPLALRQRPFDSQTGLTKFGAATTTPPLAASPNATHPAKTCLTPTPAAIR